MDQDKNKVELKLNDFDQVMLKVGRMEVVAKLCQSWDWMDTMYKGLE